MTASPRRTRHRAALRRLNDLEEKALSLERDGHPVPPGLSCAIAMQRFIVAWFAPLPQKSS